MLYYDRTDVREGIDLEKSSNSKECMICHFWLFNHGFNFEDSVCNGCHDLKMLSVSLSNTAIITIENIAHHCIIHNISKYKAINLLKSSSLSVGM